MPDAQRHTFINDLVVESVVTRMNTKKMSSLIDDRVKQLVSRRQYDTARKLAQQYPDDPTAQQYLRDIEALETPLERGVKVGMKWAAYAAGVVLVIMIVLVIGVILSLR
jgi:hypothetical protein